MANLLQHPVPILIFATILEVSGDAIVTFWKMP
jgi:hypothetical protein